MFHENLDNQRNPILDIGRLHDRSYRCIDITSMSIGATERMSMMIEISSSTYDRVSVSDGHRLLCRSIESIVHESCPRLRQHRFGSGTQDPQGSRVPRTPGGSGPRRGPGTPGDPPWEGGVPDPPRGGSKNRHPLYQRLIKWQEGRFRQCRGALVYTFLNWSGKLAFFSPRKTPPRGPRPGPLLPRDLGCLPPTWDKARPYPRHTRLINAGNDKHVDMRRQPLGHLCLLCLRGRRHYSLKMLSK